MDLGSVRSQSAGKAGRKSSASDGEVLVVALSTGKIAVRIGLYFTHICFVMGTVVTSSFCIQILSTSLAIDGAPSGASSSPCSRALLGLASVAVEPRFTCVTAWVPRAAKDSTSAAIASTDAPTTAVNSSEKKRAIDDNQTVENKEDSKHRGEPAGRGAADGGAPSSDKDRKKAKKLRKA
jgi:hypothetical protein